jgi:hypothetical protein
VVPAVSVHSDTLSKPVTPATVSEKLGEPYVTTGVILIGEAEPAPKVKQVAASFPAPPAATPPSSRPVATSPSPSPWQKASTSTTAAAPAGPSLPALKAAIEKACGPYLRDLDLKSEAGNKLMIQFSAVSEAEGKLFFNRIQALPELASYELKVHVKLPTGQ